LCTLKLLMMLSSPSRTIGVSWVSIQSLGGGFLPGASIDLFSRFSFGGAAAIHQCQSFVLQIEPRR
jgi:hypothetical protein